ncbi:hypothetical protein CR513_26193, partial [Mucuna pruriens]
MVTMFIDTFPSPFYDKVVGSVATNFADLVTVGERIESGIKRGKFAQTPTTTFVDPTPTPNIEGSSNTPNSRSGGRNRVFTPIHMSYTALLPKLLQKNLIAVLPLKPLEPPYPRSYDPNAKCEYHVGAIGHSTERYWSFKHKVQDLIDAGWLRFEENEPNVSTNPLPAHGGQSINTLSHEIRSPERRKASPIMVEEVAVVEQTDNHPQKSLIIRYNPIYRPPAPFIIQIPAKPAYKDDHVVPWQYDSCTEEASVEIVKDEAAKEVINIAEAVGGITRSGRIYSPETLKKSPTPEKIVEASKGKEAKEFLKLIWYSEYELLEQMNKTPHAHVAQDITMEKFEGMVNNLASKRCLTFSEEEIPKEGRRHNQPLHISVKYGEYMIARVLIDNGSSLNVLPKTTLDKLCSIDSRLRANSVVVRAFDGSKREVIGEITLPIYVGPTMFDVVFQVMDIYPAYSFLLGRPWIHAAGAVPSSLH